jgi:cytoskeletal protein RodZ
LVANLEFVPVLTDRGVMPELTRRARACLMTIGVALFATGVFAATVVQPGSSVALSAAADEAQSEVSTSLAPTSTTTTEATTTTTSPPPVTTIKRPVVVVTTSPTTIATRRRNGGTMACAWTFDVSPSVSGSNPVVHLHVSVPHPNTEFNFSLWPADSATGITVEKATTDGAGNVTFLIEVTPDLRGDAVDARGSVRAPDLVQCWDPSAFRFTLPS